MQHRAVLTNCNEPEQHSPAKRLGALGAPSPPGTVSGPLINRAWPRFLTATFAVTRTYGSQRRKRLAPAAGPRPDLQPSGIKWLPVPAPGGGPCRHGRSTIQYVQRLNKLRRGKPGSSFQRRATGTRSLAGRLGLAMRAAVQPSQGWVPCRLKNVTIENLRFTIAKSVNLFQGRHAAILALLNNSYLVLTSSSSHACRS